MKKIIAALMVLAMVLTMAPAVFAAETALADSIPVKSGTESITETGAIEFLSAEFIGNNSMFLLVARDKRELRIYEKMVVFTDLFIC